MQVVCSALAARKAKVLSGQIKSQLQFTSLEYTKLQVQLQVFICPHTTQPELATS